MQDQEGYVSPLRQSVNYREREPESRELTQEGLTLRRPAVTNQLSEAGIEDRAGTLMRVKIPNKSLDSASALDPTPLSPQSKPTAL